MPKYKTIPAIVREHGISAGIDHKTPEDVAVAAFLKVFHNGLHWSMAVFDYNDGLLLMCRPILGTACIGHRILNIRPGKSGGVMHVQWAAQVISHILGTDTALCVKIAESPQVVIQDIDTGVPHVFVWQPDGKLHQYNV